MRKIFEILKQIYHKLCTFIQWTKKLYFMHFVVILSMPMIAFTILTLLLIPFSTSDEMNEALGLFSWALYFLFWNSAVAIMLAMPLQIVCMFITSMFKGTIFVESKFLQNNKLYNIVYLFSLVLIIISWISANSS